MIKVIRSSQIFDSSFRDGSAPTKYNRVEEVWLDENGIVYLVDDSSDAVSSYGNSIFEPLENIHYFHQNRVDSLITDPFDWVVEDIFFDESREFARPFGSRTVFSPQDVEAIDTEAVEINNKVLDRLKSKAEKLKGFLSEKSRQIKNLLMNTGDRLYSSIASPTKPKVVRIKIKVVGDKFVIYNWRDRYAIANATNFLQNNWRHLRHSISRTGKQSKFALDAGKKST